MDWKSSNSNVKSVVPFTIVYAIDLPEDWKMFSIFIFEQQVVLCVLYVEKNCTKAFLQWAIFDLQVLTI